MSQTAFDAKDFCDHLPAQPGVYRMLDDAGEVIYVGKAVDLKKRVSSYFLRTRLAPRTQLMVSHIAGIETTVTRSEAEALLLENNLIKSLKPRYNILFRDDKTYPYVVLSGHDFPRLGFYRGTLNKTHQYFGPFPNAGVVRESIQLLQKVFRLRTCEDSVFSHRTRPCLLSQIKRCSGPCVDKISQAAYREDVHNAALFLQGKQTQVVDNLSDKMQRAADEMEYEQAALFRDQIQALRKIREKQFIESSHSQDVDVVVCAKQREPGGKVCVNLAMIRAGRHLGDKSFFPKNAEGCDVSTVVEAFLIQHYLNRAVPALIIVGARVKQVILQNLLTEQSGHKVVISQNPTGERRMWLNMAAENARLALKQMMNRQASQEERMQALQQVLTLSSLTRIECFDISHMMGEATVASCVVYDQFSMRNNEYRRYNIHDVTPGDDYAAIREAISRRYRDIVKGEGRLPDLIMIDGGKGQVNAAREALIELGLDVGLDGVNLVGVAKGVERKPGLEQLIVAAQAQPLRLPGDHAGLHLIQQIRDEAHRFAIQGHRGRRGKARTSSILEDITGVGAKRRQGLLKRFGGIKGVLTASIEELQQTEGISRQLAEKIYQSLH